MMGPDVAGNLLIVAAIPVLVARMIIIWSYGDRSWRLFVTGVLPTFAVLVLVVRVVIQRNFDDLISPTDWVSAMTWAGIVATQIAAALVQYWPVKLFRARRGTS